MLLRSLLANGQLHTITMDDQSHPLHGVQPVQPAPRKRPEWASLPANILLAICDHAPGYEPSDRYRRILLRCCKRWRTALAGALWSDEAYRNLRVFITPDGLRLLAAIAAGPFARDVRQITISRWLPATQPLKDESLGLLGVGPNPVIPPDQDRARGLETEFARQLADVLRALPALEGVSIGSGCLPYGIPGPPGFKYKVEMPAKLPYGFRTAGFRMEAADDIDVDRAIFRGVLFALASAIGTGSPATSLKLDDNASVLDSASYTFSPTELAVLDPLFGQLRTLHIEDWSDHVKDDDDNCVSDFVRRFPHLTELYLQGPTVYTSILFKLTEDPPRLPRLEKLGLKDFNIPPAQLITFLSQWNLREVYLDNIHLKQDAALWTARAAKGGRQWIGFPVLWEAVLCAVSDSTAGKTIHLGLQNVSEWESGRSRFSPRFVEFDHNPHSPGVSSYTRQQAHYKRRLVVTDLDHKTHRDGDVFKRAAWALGTPAGALPHPPEQPTTNPKFAQLPAELLIHICTELAYMKTSVLCQLRLLCRSLATALTPVVGNAVLREVSIIPSAAGVAALAEIAASPFGRYIRHVNVAPDIEQDAVDFTLGPTGRETQIAYLGAEPPPQGTQATGSIRLPPTGADTPFARELGKVLGTLPALQSSGIRPHDCSLGLGKAYFDTVTDEHIMNAVFRGLLFALAHARASGVKVATLNVEGPDEEAEDPDPSYGSVEEPDPVHLYDTAFSLEPSQRQLVGPVLGALETLRLKLAPNFNMALEDGGGFNEFISLCTGLVELNLNGTMAQPLLKGHSVSQDVSQDVPHATPWSPWSPWQATTSESPAPSAVPNLISDSTVSLAEALGSDKLAEALVSLTRLENLTLKQHTLHTEVLLQLLTQGQLRSVTLDLVTLRDETSSSSEAASEDVPRLWDQVLRAASSGASPTTVQLKLIWLRQSHGRRHDPKIYEVDFECGCDRFPAHYALVEASRPAKLIPCYSNGGSIDSDYNRDVFVRAADLLKEPALMLDEANGDSDEEY